MRQTTLCVPLEVKPASYSKLTALITELRLSTSLSNVENADLPKVIVDLQMQQTAYQASLAATSRVMQPSLLDFLR